MVDILQLINPFWNMKPHILGQTCDTLLEGLAIKAAILQRFVLQFWKLNNIENYTHGENQILIVESGFEKV